MMWAEYLLFLLVGYWLRMLSEPKKKKATVKQPVAFKMPNPVEMIQEHKLRKEEEQFDKETKIMLENIDNYNGTSNGQKEVK